MYVYYIEKKVHSDVMGDNESAFDTTNTTTTKNSFCDEKN